MIKGVHTMFYTSDAEALREFLRDKLQFPFVDTGGGWLTFDMPEADMGCHPSNENAPSGTAAISFYCDDLEETIAELKKRNVEFVNQPVDVGYGISVRFEVPGGFTVELYQPRYGK